MKAELKTKLSYKELGANYHLSLKNSYKLQEVYVYIEFGMCTLEGHCITL